MKSKATTHTPTPCSAKDVERTDGPFHICFEADKPTHTPTPWAYHLGRGKYPRFHIQTEGGYQIASTPELDSLSKEENEGRDADAAFIVRAVNAHDELLEVCKRWHGYDDAKHREAMPDCADCQIIAKAEGSGQGHEPSLQEGSL